MILTFLLISFSIPILFELIYTKLLHISILFTTKLVKFLLDENF